MADGRVSVALGSIIISFEAYGALRIVKFTKGDTDWESGNAVLVKGPSLCSSSRSHYVAKGDAFSEDDPVRWRCWKSGIGRSITA